MDYEKKYKEALEKAREWYNKTEPDSYTCIVESIFPELKESEDEKIRKALISILKSDFEKDTTIFGISVEQIIAWLEKQESLTTDEEKQGKEDVLWCIKQAKKYAKDENEMGTCWFAEQWLEKQGNKPQGKKALEAIKEEKVDNANKVEPKFNVGDWICNDACVVHIASIKNGMYYFDEGDGLDIAFVDNNYHLWTIQDAKDGDVLYSPCCKLLFIFKNNKECYVGNNLNYHAESIVINSPIYVPTDSIPTTKEQRELLFQKMHEAGYEWDVDKKEPIKIESQQAEIQKWSEEDENILKNLNDYFMVDDCLQFKEGIIVKWLESLKNRIKGD